MRLSLGPNRTRSSRSLRRHVPLARTCILSLPLLLAFSNAHAQPPANDPNNRSHGWWALSRPWSKGSQGTINLVHMALLRGSGSHSQVVGWGGNAFDAWLWNPCAYIESPASPSR